MRHKFTIGVLLFVLFLGACTQHNIKSMEIYKAEVLKAETEFAQMAKEKGVEAAFLAFADDDAVLLRGKLIKGRAEIKAYFEANNSAYKDLKLEWKPDFVEVSESGDLAYTYGGYTSKSLAEDGSVSEGSGVFHTVWKRQTDGSWKFVWD